MMEISNFINNYNWGNKDRTMDDKSISIYIHQIPL